MSPLPWSDSKYNPKCQTQRRAKPLATGPENDEVPGGFKKISNWRSSGQKRSACKLSLYHPYIVNSQLEILPVVKLPIPGNTSSHFASNRVLSACTECALTNPSFKLSCSLTPLVLNNLSGTSSPHHAYERLLRLVRGSKGCANSACADYPQVYYFGRCHDANTSFTHFR